jgi:hypothetical protein
MHTSDGTDLAVHDLGGSGDDRLLVQGADLCAQMLPPMAHALAADHPAQQMTGRSAWTCLNDSVPPAGRVPALEVQ